MGQDKRFSNQPTLKSRTDNSVSQCWQGFQQK